MRTATLTRPTAEDSWRLDALCTEIPDPAIFFPETHYDPKTAQTEALLICGKCTTRDECLAYAIETNQADGIWGGVEAVDRKKLRRRWLTSPRP